MITAVDTNILLYLLVPETPHAGSSEVLLEEAHQQGALVVSEIVYAELASRFPSPGEIDVFLGKTGIRLEQSRREALQVASEAWRVYTSRRRRSLQCSRCGQSQTVKCPQCGSSIRPRQHILSDFLIGGHALQQADRLLTETADTTEPIFLSCPLPKGIDSLPKFWRLFAPPPQANRRPRVSPKAERPTDPHHRITPQILVTPPAGYF